MPDEMQAAPNYIRAFASQTVKSVDKAAREVVHMITSPAVDRAGDIVEPAGVDLTNFLRNPVVIANHDYAIENVVGRATSIEVADNGLVAKTTFRDTPLARDAFALASEGLGGWSIGFRPIEYDSIKDEKGAWKGFRFKKWELLEYSIVAIPMNPDIVNNAIRRGLVCEANVGAFFRTAEGILAPVNAASQGTDGLEIDLSAVHPALASILARHVTSQAIAEILRGKFGD